jgi:hypothetical protein
MLRRGKTCRILFRRGGFGNLSGGSGNQICHQGFQSGRGGGDQNTFRGGSHQPELKSQQNFGRGGGSSGGRGGHQG